MNWDYGDSATVEITDTAGTRIKRPCSIVGIRTLGADTGLGTGPLLPPVATMLSMTCPVCHSPNVIPDVELLGTRFDVSGTLVARVQQDPAAIVFTGSVFSDLRARVCGNCGHTTLHAVDHKDLWQAHQKAQDVTT